MQIIRKTKIKCKSQIAFNDTQEGFSYDNIIKSKIMYHLHVMSWHGFMMCIRKQNQQENKHVNNKQKWMTIMKREKNFFKESKRKT